MNRAQRRKLQKRLGPKFAVDPKPVDPGFVDIGNTKYYRGPNGQLVKVKEYKDED